MKRESYKSFFWSLGNTGFRHKEIAYESERQLELLTEFWKMNNESWNPYSQEKYYDILASNDILEGNSSNKAKDARLATSALVDMGLVDSNRHITLAGKKLLKIVNGKRNNIMNIDDKSYFYLLQLMKTYKNISGNMVRPIIILIRLLTELGEISDNVFSYVVPLIINEGLYVEIVRSLKNMEFEDEEDVINALILRVLESNDSFSSMRMQFVSEERITDDLIIASVMNRKSDTYSKPYVPLFYGLLKLFRKLKSNKTIMFSDISNIELAIKYLTGTKNLWMKLLFKGKRSKVLSDWFNFNNPLFSTTSEEGFKYHFFNYIHIFKTCITLKDYKDLDRRYMKLTDIFIFEDGIVKMDIVPSVFFSLCQDALKSICFSASLNLESDSSIDDIIPNLAVSKEMILYKLKEKYGQTYTDYDDMIRAIELKKERDFDSFITQRFPVPVLIELLSLFKNRTFQNDKKVFDAKICKIVTEDADIPTIFEYIIGIIWYIISEKKVSLLHAYNLSLGPDFLPRMHAGGGKSDIIFSYYECEAYPNHSLLVEVTLSSGSNLLKMELEPVSRHLADYILENNDENAYSILIAPEISRNGISYITVLMNTPLGHSQNFDSYRELDGVRIVPLNTDTLQKILERKVTYSKLYSIFSHIKARKANEINWYEDNIGNKI